MADQRGSNEIDAWIATHRDSLPQTLGELTRLPVAYRGAIVRALPPEVRVAIWREHYAAFLRADSLLSPAQRDFIRESAVALPTLMSDDVAAAQTAARAFERRMPALFSRTEAGEIFGRIGPAEPSEGLPAPTR